MDARPRRAGVPYTFPRPWIGSADSHFPAEVPPIAPLPSLQGARPPRIRSCRLRNRLHLPPDDPGHDISSDAGDILPGCVRLAHAARWRASIEPTAPMTASAAFTFVARPMTVGGSGWLAIRIPDLSPCRNPAQQSLVVCRGGRPRQQGYWRRGAFCENHGEVRHPGARPAVFGLNAVPLRAGAGDGEDLLFTRPEVC